MKRASLAVKAAAIASALLLAGGYIAYEAGGLRGRTATVMSSSKSKALVVPMPPAQASDEVGATLENETPEHDGSARHGSENRSD